MRSFALAERVSTILSEEIYSNAVLIMLVKFNTEILVDSNPRANVTLKCYIQTNGFPVNIVLVKKKQIFPYW
jgi:hypothetical protein